MRKAYICIILALLVTVPLYSLDFVAAPYSGFSGIPVGNNTYKGGSGWGSAGQSNNRDTYDNVEMIALITLPSIPKADYSKNFTVSVSCPNGMYMTSLSNPEFKRPIKLMFYPVITGSKRGTSFELSNNNPVETYSTSTDPKLKDQSIGNTWNFWFDVVVCLPGEVDNENDRLIDDDGTIYPLIKVSDYTAIVTITVDFETASRPLVMTIPFTGYYDGTTNPPNISSSLPISLGVETYPEASNISLETNNRGQWTSVGKINLLLQGEKKLALFISSESSATIPGDKFKMVKDDLEHDTQLTSVNSIGFEAQLVSSDGSINLFDGTDYVSLSTSIENLPSNFVKMTGNAISKIFSTHGNAEMKYRQYEGELQVKLERSDVTLLEGRYEGELYIHVLVE